MREQSLLSLVPFLLSIFIVSFTDGEGKVKHGSGPIIQL